MNVIIASPYALCTPHFETELEIMQKQLDAGHAVTYLTCDSVLMACEGNFFQDLYRCRLCVKMRQNGLELLSGPVHQLPLLRLTEKQSKKIEDVRRHFVSLDDLRSYFIANFDIGWGALSSLVFSFREPEIDLQSEPQKSVLERIVVGAAQVYYSVLNHLRDGSFDQVYLFNGRFATLRAVMRACQAAGVKFVSHERGANKDKYQLFENTLPHDINYMTKLITSSWEEAEISDNRATVASQFFENSRQGVSHSWYSFTSKQTEGLLPINWDKSKRNLVIFVSSEDEFVAIDESWLNPIYCSQNDGIERIIQSLGGNPDIHIYLRIHPNLKGLKNSQVKFFDSLNSENLTLISADSPISSYALMLSATQVLTFGSTTGVEATFWGIPSILLGKSFYQDLGATYNPTCHDELLDLIHSDLPPKPKKGALMYGYHFFTCGIPFSYFHAKNFSRGTFCSKSGNICRDLSPYTGLIIARFSISYLKKLVRKFKSLLTFKKSHDSIELQKDKCNL